MNEAGDTDGREEGYIQGLGVENNIKMDVNWIHLAQKTDRWRIDAVMSLCVQ
jgi:hypothetical protein